MTITRDQFEEVRKVLEGYKYRHQPDDRGPGCSVCARVSGPPYTHSTKDQAVCLTVTELLYDLEKLIEVEGPTPDDAIGEEEAEAEQERRHEHPVLGCDCHDCIR